MPAGGVAARLAGWARSHRNLPGPLLGASLAGLPFLTDVFGANARLLVEAAFGANVKANADTWSWTDITADVRYADGGRVTVSPVGRADETSKSQPAGCVFQLDNTRGDYSKSPASKWYPYIRRNTPIRVRVTLDGSSWYVRFQGYANGFTPSWDTSANLAVVSVSAAGVLRRLQQGTSPLKSPMYRAASALSPLAHWPLEDASGVTLAGSSVSNGLPLTVTTAGPVFGKTGADAPGGAVSAVEVTAGVLSGALAGTSTAGWAVSFAFRGVKSAASATLGSEVNSVSWHANGYRWMLEIYDDDPDIIHGVLVGPRQIGSEANRVSAVTADGTAANTERPLDGNWHTVVVQATQSGSNATVNLYYDGSLAATKTGAHTLGALSGAVACPDLTLFPVFNLDTFEVSHIAFYETTTAPTGVADATDGYTGESTSARLARLCTEEGVPLNVVGSSTTTMGVQGVDTFVNLLRECETTDDGVLYDGRSSGLSYVTREARYNAATALTADMSADPPQVALPFVPVDDDQRNRNKMKVDRKNGSSATYEDATGTLGTSAIGVYDSSVTVNTEDDTGLLFRAGWEVHKGTVDSPYRYPALSLDLAAVPVLAPGWLAMDVSSRIAVANVTSKATQHPPGTLDLLLEGWSETLSPFDWAANANCSPYQPWRVGVIEGTGDTAWRIDSGGSTLSAAAAVGATSLTVAVTDGLLWSTSAGDYPRDINVGGVQVTATAVSGASSPQTFTVTALPYALTAGWSISLWRPTTIAL